MNQPLLSGRTEPDEVQKLRSTISQLEGRIEHLEAALKESREQGAASIRACSRIKSQLAPLHSALKDLFGEFDSMHASEESASHPQVSARVAAAWENWKHKFGGGTAQVIDALLLHKEMDTTQLSIATGLHRTSIPKIIYKLSQASLINKNGGRFSLKQL